MARKGGKKRKGDGSNGSGEDRIFVCIPSQPKYIRCVRALISRAAQEYPVPEGEVREMVLAVDEACSNIIKHAYEGDEKQTIEVTLHLSPEAIRVEIRDYGSKAHPTKIHPRALDDVKPGGLGTHFMKCCMDLVEFDTSPPKGNILRMVKKLGPLGAGS